MGEERIHELTSINSSLSALAGVVSALTEGVSRKHVPYRNSKLTSLLQVCVCVWTRDQVCKISTAAAALKTNSPAMEWMGARPGGKRH